MPVVGKRKVHTRLLIQCLRALSSVAGQIQNIQMVFDIPERRSARSHRFDVRAADGTLLELAAATAEEKSSWMQALSSVVASTGLEEHPRAKDF